MPHVLARDVQTCRGHHAVLRELLDTFPAPVAVNASRLRTVLSALETVLLRHLAFEDARLYPALQAAAEPALAERARRYREEMGDLSERAFAFFERWRAEPAIEAEPATFAEAWNSVRTALERRMAAEDTDLYDVAEQLSL